MEHDMSRLRLYQVDAFAGQVFQGNPAAVVPLEAWPDDALLQAIASENNLSETAYFVPAAAGFELRWFTPAAEVDLCGHATLASAHVLYAHLGYAEPRIAFATRSGELQVFRTGEGYCLDFPGEGMAVVAAPSALLEGLGVNPREVRGGSDYLVVLDSQAAVRELVPDFHRLRQLDRRGVIVTAPGDDCDFVSRCFYPRLGIDEDPVTGSAHCALATYWAQRLGQLRLRARQLSRRGGLIDCEVRGERVLLTGGAVDYLEGEIRVPWALRQPAG